jgi:hypothetical protein
MLFRAIACCAALIAALLFSLNAGAEPAETCEGADCPAASAAPAVPAAHPSKPLDIMKFMREQAASTRVGEKPAARPQHAVSKHPAVAAKPQPKPMPAEAASSFAAQPVAAPPEVEVVSADELNAIDRAGEPAPPPPETVGAPPTIEPVQVVKSDAVNSIDRAGEAAPALADAMPHAIAAQSGSEAQSWLQWLWSAVQGTFAALATAVHRLLG